MPYSLQQAATAADLNKSTVLRAIKAGKISAARDEHGQWQIEPAELHRVYPPVARTESGAAAGNGERNGAHHGGEHTRELAEAQQRAALAWQRAADLAALVEDVRTQRDKWQAQAEAVSRLLTDQRDDRAQRRPWWRRLAG